MPKFSTAIAPSHWATYLFYGDTDALDELEIQQAEAFAKGRNFVLADDAGFCRIHDAAELGVLPCDCQLYTYSENTVSKRKRP
jgi:hypothetical protein